MNFILHSYQLDLTSWNSSRGMHIFVTIQKINLAQYSVFTPSLAGGIAEFETW
jgi:hypothetical protein